MALPVIGRQFGLHLLTADRHDALLILEVDAAIDEELQRRGPDAVGQIIIAGNGVAGLELQSVLLDQLRRGHEDVVDVKVLLTEGRALRGLLTGAQRIKHRELLFK